MEAVVRFENKGRYVDHRRTDQSLPEKEWSPCPPGTPQLSGSFFLRPSIRAVTASVLPVDAPCRRLRTLFTQTPSPFTHRPVFAIDAGGLDASSAPASRMPEIGFPAMPRSAAVALLAPIEFGSRLSRERPASDAGRGTAESKSRVAPRGSRSVAEPAFL